MKKSTRWAKIPAILAVLASLSACSAYVPYTDSCRSLVQSDLNGEKTLTFDDENQRYKITLKITDISHLDYLCESKIKVSYLIDINSPLSKNGASIYLRLLDADGFEIEKYFVSNVVKNYVGTLKGTLDLEALRLPKFSGAELVIYSNKT